MSRIQIQARIIAKGRYGSRSECWALRITNSSKKLTILKVFALLVFEMALFATLIIPLPFKLKRGLFTFISENPIVAKIQYGMKVSSTALGGVHLLALIKTAVDYLHLYSHPLRRQRQPRLPSPG
jgi:hypothetical protein